MKRLIGTYGKVLLTSGIVAIVVGVFLLFGDKLEKESTYKAKETADNVREDMRNLGEQKKYPFFVGNQYITLTVGYKGGDGEVGFSRNDALDLVEAYEYRIYESKETLEKIEKEKIRIYPFDDASGDRKFVDVSNTGKYTVKYAVEGESGLTTEMTMLVLVDILPEGIECRESVGGKNESSD